MDFHESRKRPRPDEQYATDVKNAQKPRLTRACAECKKHKIKCAVQPGNTSCDKCIRSNIECVPYNFAQKFMDEVTVWKDETHATQQQLKTAVQFLLRQNGFPDLSKFVDGFVPPLTTAPTPVQPTRATIQEPPPSSQMSVSPGNIVTASPSVATTSEEADLVSAPMSNLYALTETRHASSVQRSDLDSNVDFISQGSVSLYEAQRLWTYYREFINPLLWAGILCPYETLHEARQSSKVLVAAVITVAALHSPSKQGVLQSSYEAFTSLVEKSCLARCSGLDNIRGLCIGAFYLTNLSWRLCSQAIRMGTEINLHQAGLQLGKGDLSLECHERLRLWYVLYVCDHQFAIAYGRPPSMSDDTSVRKIGLFLESPTAINGDVRLTAQVEVFRVLAEAYFLYGHDPDLILNSADFEKLRSLNISCDQWRLTYQSQSADMPVYGTYPSKGTILYFHFARFQLNSLALRSLTEDTNMQELQPSQFLWDIREAAQMTISAAISTLRLVIDEPDLRRALVGVPIFTHSMVAMCATTLLKIAIVFGQSMSTDPDAEDSKYHVQNDLSSHGLTFYTIEAIQLVQQLITVLAEVAAKVSPQHLSSHIVAGLTELISRFKPCDDGCGFIYTRRNHPAMPLNASTTLLPSRPPSRNGNRPPPPWQDQIGVSGLAPSHDSVAHQNVYSEISQDMGMVNMLGGFDWGFDDNLLWQLDNDPFLH